MTHPWAHLEKSFQILIAGHKERGVQGSIDYFLAWTRVNTALCAGEGVRGLRSRVPCRLLPPQKRG